MWYEVYCGERGRWPWRLWSDNGAAITEASEGYVAKARCLYDIALNKASTAAPGRDLLHS